MATWRNEGSTSTTKPCKHNIGYVIITETTYSYEKGLRDDEVKTTYEDICGNCTVCKQIKIKNSQINKFYLTEKQSLQTELSDIVDSISNLCKKDLIHHYSSFKTKKLLHSFLKKCNLISEYTSLSSFYADTSGQNSFQVLNKCFSIDKTQFNSSINYNLILKIKKFYAGLSVELPHDLTSAIELYTTVSKKYDILQKEISTQKKLHTPKIVETYKSNNPNSPD